MTVKLLMSACLVGQCCRYDAKNGTSIVNKTLHNMLNTGEVYVFCPECAGGLDVPRDPAEIEPGKTAADVLSGKGKVLTNKGADVTAAYLSGASQMLEKAKALGIKVAVMKERSPACGVHQVYDGTHSGKLVAGRGVTTELLIENGIAVFDETEFDEALKAVK